MLLDLFESFQVSGFDRQVGILSKFRISQLEVCEKSSPGHGMGRFGILESASISLYVATASRRHRQPTVLTQPTVRDLKSVRWSSKHEATSNGAVDMLIVETEKCSFLFKPFC